MKTLIRLENLIVYLAMLTISSAAMAKSLSPSIKEETVTYTVNGVTMKGFVVYDQNIKGKRPAVIVVHEWWGLNDYPKMRARQLAELGYIAMAADMFGNGKTASNPTEAQNLTMPFYKDPKLSEIRLNAAIRKLKEFPQTDPANIASIGYCFGGFVVLNAAKLGADLKGVVSFHGGMGGAPVDKKLLKASVLVCYGGKDKFVQQKDVELFKHQLDSIGVNNTFKFYADATHAFTNPEATKLGKEFNLPIEYNADADRNSWNEMKLFLKSIFTK